MPKVAQALARSFRDALTVEQLIEELQSLNQQARVAFVCDYGDYSHTQQVLPIEQATAVEQIGHLYESAYSHSNVALREDDDRDEDETEQVEEDLIDVVVLSDQRY